MRIKPLVIYLLLTLTLFSCFEEDQPVPPYHPPDDVETVHLQNSIYTHQVYFDFRTGSIVGENENSEWVLGFECLDSAYHIRVNSSDLWAIAHTGSENMSRDFSEDDTYTWASDKADGNPDSTAVGAWVSFEDGKPAYTNEVMLLGQYDGIVYRAAKKMQFIMVDEASYIFLVSDPDASMADTVVVTKNENFNHVHYSLNNDEMVQLEPRKDDWDILFSQYFTILYTDDGIPAPYYVRGVLLNPNLVVSALDTTSHFMDITAASTLSYEFSSLQDAIGHDWKSVEIDEVSNSAVYKIRPGYTYIIRDRDNELYKFRFKSYFNPSGEKGFPSFEYSGLGDPSSN